VTNRANTGSTAATTDTGGPTGAGVSTRRRDPLRRERILVAAAELFATRGYDRTSMKEIGQAAGITGSAIYRHFDDKEAILVSLFARLVSRLQTATLALMSSDADADERLHKLIELAVEGTLADRNVVGLTPRDLYSVSREARAQISTEQAKILKTWTQLLRDARPELTAQDARTMLGAIRGMTSAVSQDSVVSERRLKALLTGMLEAALRATPVDDF
jgi:AcrR family transcriptional regulator